MSETPVKEWNFNPEEILSSPRKVKGIFHQPVVDKDGEIINSKGMREAVPDFMHLPALHDFHKERPVGLATKVQELGGGRFYMEGVIKATHDCDDVWDKVKTGNYGQMSIFGKRTKYNNQCALPQSMRNGPCVTDGVRLDSISICDENARNPQTSLEMMKAKVVFDAEELRKATESEKETAKRGQKMRKYNTREIDLIPDDAEEGPYPYGKKPVEKAETAGDSSLMHTSTDYAGGKVRITKCPRCNKPKEDPVTTISKENIKKAEGDDESPEEHPTTRERGPRAGGKKEVRHPFAETGSAHPKRSKAGYPLTEGGNIPQKPHRPSGAKGEPSKPETEMRERTTAAHAVRHYETEAMKEKMGEHVKHGGTKKEQRHYKIGAPIKPRAHKGGEEPERTPERGSSVAGEQAASAAERHKEQQTKFDKADTMDEDVGKAGKRPSVSEEPAKTGGTSQNTRKNVTKEVRRPREEGGYHGGQFEKAEDEEMEKGYSKTSHKEHLNDRDKDREHSYAEDRRRDRDMQGEDESELKRGLKKSAAEDLSDEDYDEEDDKEFKHLKPSDKEGNWNKSKNPNGTPGLKKAKDKNKDSGPDEEDEENEEEQEEKYEEEEEEIDKAVTYAGNPKPMYREKGQTVPNRGSTRPLSSKEGPASTKGHKEGIVGGSAESRKKHGLDPHGSQKAMREGYREARKDIRGIRSEHFKKGDEDGSSELFDPSTVSKGEQMGDETEQDVEYVTKALVPIEEIDTIVKARTEEISKAYMGRLDEIVKAYDEKVGTLVSRIEKMENETIRKGGSVVVIQELLNSDGTGAQSNADAVAQMQQARR